MMNWSDENLAMVYKYITFLNEKRNNERRVIDSRIRNSSRRNREEEKFSIPNQNSNRITHYAAAKRFLR
jgi:hypothetical protein